jgi:L-threonylcarbamoyladenylate synthase
MEFISNCTADAIANAAKALIDGHLVAFPTETVYGLGADANNSKAVARIYEVKARPTDHPLIVHISSINQISKWARDIPDYAITLARKFWPGPMTLILPRTDLAKDYITGGQNNVGLRVPAQPIALALLNKFEELGGLGIAAPSANRFGSVSSTTAGAVSEELSEYFDVKDLVLDGGQCFIGIESTIIDCTSSKYNVLRPGSITRKDIENLLGMQERTANDKNQVRSSGNLISHYKPKTQILVNEEIMPGDGLIAPHTFPTPVGTFRLLSPKNSIELARDLYATYRVADKLNLKRTVIIISDNDELTEAILERVVKSAQ